MLHFVQFTFVMINAEGFATIFVPQFGHFDGSPPNVAKTPIVVPHIGQPCPNPIPAFITTSYPIEIPVIFPTPEARTIVPGKILTGLEIFTPVTSPMPTTS